MPIILATVYGRRVLAQGVPTPSACASMNPSHHPGENLALCDTARDERDAAPDRD